MGWGLDKTSGLFTKVLMDQSLQQAHSPAWIPEVTVAVKRDVKLTSVKETVFNIIFKLKSKLKYHLLYC